MNFAHDTTQNFYYLGEAPPYKGIYQDKLSSCKLISVDAETISLKERIAIGVSVAVSPSQAFYFPLFPEPSPITPWHLLKDPAVRKVFQNGIFDLFCLREFEVDDTNIWDTNIASRLLCYPDNSLAGLWHIHGMEVKDAKSMLVEAGVKTMLELPKDDVARKCMQDSLATYKLYQEFEPRVDRDYISTELQVIPILLKMSFRGIRIDQEVRARLEAQLIEETEFYRNLCDELEGFMPSSPQQVSYVLAKRGAYRSFTRLPFTKTRKLGSGKEILEKMDDPLAAIILNYKQKAALLNNYIIPWGRDDRATTRFHLDAITGRPTSTERNLQNIPQGEPRNVFLPDSAIFTDYDFSQVELRILAHLSEDREMQYIFSLPKLLPDGSKNIEADIHQQTADFLGIKRGIAKNTNFSMIYGGDDQTIAETAGIRSIKRAHQLKELWFQKFPQAGDWIQGVQAETYDNPYATTIFGRKMRLDFESPDLASMMRKNINYRIQGSAAEILKRSLIACKDLDLALTVHDEILCDGYVEEEWLKDKLERISPLYTPIEVKYLGRWE